MERVWAVVNSLFLEIDGVILYFIYYDGYFSTVISLFLSVFKVEASVGSSTAFVTEEIIIIY